MKPNFLRSVETMQYIEVLLNTVEFTGLETMQYIEALGFQPAEFSARYIEALSVISTDKEAKEFLRLPSTREYIGAMEKVGISHVYEARH